MLTRWNAHSQGFKDLVPHNPDSPLTSLHVANDDALVLLYSVDVKDELYLHSLATGERIRRLGEGLIGSIDQIAGRREHGEFWFSMTSFTSPGTVYRFDFSDKDAAGKHEGKEAVYREAKVEGIQPSDFVSEQVFYQSKDGTKVPMFITRPKECVAALCSSLCCDFFSRTTLMYTAVLAASRRTARRRPSCTATAASRTP